MRSRVYPLAVKFVLNVAILVQSAAPALNAQMTPAEYGQAIGAGFQNSYQNILMGMQASREQRQLDLQYRQQELYEQQAALERKIAEQNLVMAKQRNELIEKRFKMNEDLEKQIHALLEERTKQEGPFGPALPNASTGHPSKDHWPKIGVPPSLRVSENEIIAEINQYRALIDKYAISGNLQMAENVFLKEPDMRRFPALHWPEIYIFMDQEVEKYKFLIISSFKK